MVARRADDDLFVLVRSEPKRALDVVDETLAEGVADPADRARVLRAGALAARLTGDLKRSNDYLDDAVTAAIESGDPAVLAEVHITLSGNQFRAGDPETALDTLRAIPTPEDAALASRIGLQIGTIYARTSRFEEAVVELESALRHAENAGDQMMVAGISKNLGLLRAYNGDYADAVTGLQAARAIYEEAGVGNEVAYCDHNLGLVAAYSGDLPAAFRLFSAAEEQIAELAGSEWEVQVGRVDAMLSAGLATDAARLGRELAETAAAADFQIERGEALRAEAAAHFMLGDYLTSRQIAEEAGKLFAAHGRTGWRAAAELLAARSARAGQAPSDPGTIGRLVVDLEDAGLANIELDARIEEAATLIDDDPHAALERLNEVSGRTRRATVEIQLAERAAQAGALRASGNRRRAAAVARGAIDLVLEYQKVLGSGDLRVGVALHATGASDIGLGLALEAGHPRRIFDWLERTKAIQLRHRGILPEPDPELRSALTQLRSLSALMDEAEGPADTAVDQRRRRAEQRVQDRYRAVQGEAPEWRPARAEDALAELNARTMVSYGALDGEVFAIKLRSGRAYLRRLGPSASIHRLARLARADLRRMATGIADDATDSLERLNALLVAPLGDLGDDVVVLPTPALFGVPWGALPKLSGIALSIAPNAAMALTPPGSSGDRTALVAGPRLVQAEPEVRAIRKELGEGEVLAGDTANHDAVLAAFEGADVAHVAAHGHVRIDNPLFSSLELSDGPLNVYELETLRHHPDVVVLSACHVGLPSAQPGRALLGLVGALLSMGTRTVIASTLPLPDTATTVGYMTDLHQAMADGATPAAAAVTAKERSGEPLLYGGAISVFGSG